MVALVAVIGATVAMVAPVMLIYGPNVALIATNLMLWIGLGACLLIGKRRPLGTPLTWGEAFVAGTFVFTMLLLAYGVIPHQWLEYSEKDLLWRADKFALGFSGDGIKLGDAAKNLGGQGRILVSFQAVSDMIAAGFYIIFLGGQIAFWSAWQKRGRKQPELEASSAFGRPVVKKA